MVVRPDCVEALCDAIQQLKSDPDLRTQLASEGRSRVHAHHSIESAASEMYGILFE